MSRLDKLRVLKPHLTEIARGYANPTLLAPRLAPIVSVTKQKVTYPDFSKQFLKEYDTKRAPGADYNRMMPEDLDPLDAALKVHSLGFPIDVQDSEEATDRNLEMEAADGLNLNFGIARDREVVTAFTTAATYAAGNKVTLAGNDQWNSGDAAADMTADLKDGRIAVLDSFGMKPNTIVISRDAFELAKTVSAIMDRIKYSQLGVLTEELLARLWEVEQVVVADAFGAGADGSFTKLWPRDKAWVGYVNRSARPTRHQVSFAYTLEHVAYPEVHEWQRSPHIRDIIRDDCRAVVLVAPQCGYLLSDVLAAA